MKQGVYAVLNTKNGQRYVGASVYIEKRFSGHIRRLQRGDHQNKKLQAAWDEFGNVFYLEILEECSRTVHREREKYWIATLDSCENGYNSTPLGAGPDVETRAKISRSNIEKPRSTTALHAEARSEEGRRRRSEMMRKMNQEGKTGGKLQKARREGKA